MKIGISGYGRMGKMIHGICVERGHSVPLVIDPRAETRPDNAATAPDPASADLSGVDMVIDFSIPDVILKNIAAYIAAGVPAVIGTTGWEHSRIRVQQQIENAGGSLLHGSNFSVGANLFFHLSSKLADLVNGFEQYDVLMHEFHHRHKKDSPSGTALTTAEHILGKLDRKTTVQTECLQRTIRPEELHVSSTRGGDIPGLHMVLADSPEDTIELRHTARSRRGFALGAVLAAEWLHGKQGFFSFEDYFREAMG